MRREIYFAIALIGIVFAFLYATIADNPEMAITTVLITLHVMGYVYLFDEWRYYRSHNAILASFQFMAIPMGLLIIGNLLAPDGYQPGMINFSLSIFDGIYATSSLASFILLISIIAILRLTARYYDDRYSGFVYRNKRYGNLKFPLFLHVSCVALIILLSSLIDRYDVLAFGFVLASIIQWFAKLIYPSINQRISDARYNRQMRRRQRRGYMSSILSNSPSRSRRNRGGSSSVSDTPSVSATNTTTRNRPTGRSVSTSPSSGYREIPTRSRNNTREPSRSSRSTSNSRPTPSRSVAEVDRGVDIIPPSRQKKVKSSKLRSYLPSGNFDSSDLKCIVCYDEFSSSSSQNIVICPECKFPGHESEFLAWLNTSPRCPRCNKEIANRRRLRSKTVSESQYAKFIRKL